MKTLFKHFSLVLVTLVCGHVFAESLYSSNLQTRLIDLDKDGVIQARDLCPDTPIGSAVDNNGCPNQSTKLLSVELNVLFASGKSDVNPRFYPEIDELASFLKKHPSSSIVIEGHTDDRGSDQLNRSLSQARATAIADVLIDRSRISQSRVKGVGFGESRPIADNNTEEGRAANRRVVAEVYAQEQQSSERWTIFSVDKNSNTALNRIY